MVRPHLSFPNDAASFVVIHLSETAGNDQQVCNFHVFPSIWYLTSWNLTWTYNVPPEFRIFDEESSVLEFRQELIKVVCLPCTS